MRKAILSIFILFLFFGSGVFAQTELSNPGLTPDSPFYFLDTLGEKIGMFFAFGSEKKAEKALKIAEEKLAEVKAMAEKNKTKALEKANQRYQEFLNLANSKTQKAKEKGKDVERLVTLISEKTLKHQEVLSEILEKIPEQAKSGIEKAIEVSKKGFEEVIKAVSGEKRGELEKRAEEIKNKIEEKTKKAPSIPEAVPPKGKEKTPPVEKPEKVPTPSKTEKEKTKISEKKSEMIQLEEYKGNFFTIKKPVGWEMITAGSCSTFSFLIRDKEKPERQIFYFGEVGPVYLDERQKQIDKEYMDMGGYPIIWYEMPVVKPLTPENFLKSFYLIAQTNIAKNFMPQVPELKNVEIISSNKEESLLKGETKTMRALFFQNGSLGEGLFYITVTEMLPVSGLPGGGIGYGFSFIGISAGKDEFRIIENKLSESLASLNISEEYVSNCLRQQVEQTQTILKAGKMLSETSDIIMDSWEKRNKIDDIISEKRSDAILGRERVYDPDTGEVYEVPLGFYEKYDINREKYQMNNLQKLPENDWNLWTAPLLDGKRIH